MRTHFNVNNDFEQEAEAIVSILSKMLEDKRKSRNSTVDIDISARET
jgi:hypothetical protein